MKRNLNDPNLIAPIAVGYWKSEYQPEFPDPKKFVTQDIPDHDRQVVLTYLASGKKFLSYLGYSYCRFECGTNDSEMGASCFTDGKYVWPEGLSHYIRMHSVWLPKEFINHVMENHNNDNSAVDLMKMTLHDFTWWKKQSTI